MKFDLPNSSATRTGEIQVGVVGRYFRVAFGKMCSVVCSCSEHSGQLGNMYVCGFILSMYLLSGMWGLTISKLCNMVFIVKVSSFDFIMEVCYLMALFGSLMCNLVYRLDMYDTVYVCLIWFDEKRAWV